MQMVFFLLFFFVPCYHEYSACVAKAVGTFHVPWHLPLVHVHAILSILTLHTVRQA